jgi:hypothetical protein
MRLWVQLLGPKIKSKNPAEIGMWLTTECLYSIKESVGLILFYAKKVGML